MSRETDCPDCGGIGIKPTCTNCSHHRFTGQGGGASMCTVGAKMDSIIVMDGEEEFNCSVYKKTKRFISDHNKCRTCVNGKITVYTEEELQEAKKKERRAIVKMVNNYPNEDYYTIKLLLKAIRARE